MDIRKVKKLIELLEESNIAEIEIKEGEEAVRISRGITTVAPSVVAPSAPIAAAAPAVADAPIVDSIVKEEAQDVSMLGKTIDSPMVGTFYSAPSPDSAPFITVGQEIQQGDVVCIIEAMKIMNKIQADKSGKVSKILVQDGVGVEFGQALIVIQ